ncbi:MAG: biotin/lipoyl-containing protein [Oscillospiraceae bacterium]|nr:biotin/lipoyl-containing protein [Oscillospiraceae bacterium]
MEEKDIRKYAGLMQELELTGLELSENGKTVRLERISSIKEAAPVYMPQSKAAEEDRYDCINICSPMVGVFYNSPAENAAPFVQAGGKVRKGEILGIIESMKLMNEVIAEQDGTICEVCVGNGDIVDFGHVLFRLGRNNE